MTSVATASHTVARIVCAWCAVLIAVECWPFDAAYGAETTSHGMCQTCFDESED